MRGARPVGTWPASQWADQTPLGRPRAVNRRSALTNADNRRQLHRRSEPHQPTSPQVTSPPIENQGKKVALKDQGPYLRISRW